MNTRVVSTSLLVSIICLVCAANLAIADQSAPLEAPFSLWYGKPASAWTEALPIGNGRLGAMMF